MRKIVISIVFVIAIVLLNACRSTCSCASIDKQEINKTQTSIASTQKAEVQQ